MFSSSSRADNFDDHFAIVFIDEVTESKYGAVPLDRVLLANAIEEISRTGAKAVVLKFFLDRAKDDVGDQLLAEAITRLPVILQTRIDDNEASPNNLPARFTLPLKTETSIKGESGWIPDLKFSTAAYDIGFVDFNGFPVPLLETYKGRTVKSLFLPAIELAYGDKAFIESGRQARIGPVTLNLNATNQVAVDLQSLPEMHYIPFHDVLENQNWSNQVKGKVVIFGYDGPKIHRIETKLGPVAAHKMFIYVLRALLQDDS